MTLPMSGKWRVLVHGVRAFTIHGDEYLELHIEPVEPKMPGSVYSVRVSSHAIGDRSIASGQIVVLTFLMGQVTSAELVA